MTRETKGKLLKGSALAIDVGVPFVTAVSYFPVWVDRGTESTVSGLSVLLVLLCIIPFFRKLREVFKSPSMPLVWTVLFLLFTALESIVREIKVICLFGMVANYAGSALYKIGSKMCEEDRPKE